MKFTNKLAGALLATTLLASASQAQLAIDFDASGATNYDTSIWNLGFSFTANEDLTVVALGNWFGGDFPQDQLVGLWDDQGNLLASTLVSNSDATVGNGSWKFHSIGAVSLVRGHTYIVGGQGGAYYTGGIPTVTVDSRITYGTDLYVNVNDGDPLTMPTATESYPHGWFGGNVEFGTAAVPEPASWALMLGGFGLVGSAMRRRKISVSFG